MILCPLKYENPHKYEDILYKFIFTCIIFIYKQIRKAKPVKAGDAKLKGLNRKESQPVARDLRTLHLAKFFYFKEGCK